MPTIRINSDLLGGHNYVGVHGRQRRIPHNEDVPVNAAELEVLTNSNIPFDIVDGAADAPEATGGAAGGSAASPDPKPKRKRGRPAGDGAPKPKRNRAKKSA